MQFEKIDDKKLLEDGAALAPRFGADGLITAVVTDAASGELLMLAHMNGEALSKTIETGEGWYWSRSRRELWHKGDTSGAIQDVVEMRIDCDQDAVWLKVRVRGSSATCHTGGLNAIRNGMTMGEKSGNIDANTISPLSGLRMPTNATM
jgi:phosphoribosyl-AMP cyclohydrolase